MFNIEFLKEPSYKYNKRLITSRIKLTLTHIKKAKITDIQKLSYKTPTREVLLRINTIYVHSFTCEILYTKRSI